MIDKQSGRISGISREKLSNRVSAEIKEYIVRNKLRPGDRLPTELELIKAFGVSRSTIREAIRVLEITGMVTSKPKLGIILNNFSLKPTLEHLSFFIRNSNISFEEILESRTLIEQLALELAVKRIKKEDLKRMEGTIASIEGASCSAGTAEKWDTADEEFHRSIFHASHNRILIALWDLFAETIRGIKAFSIESAKRGLEEHRKIYTYLKKKDARKAKKLFRQHMEKKYREIKRGRYGRERTPGIL